MRAPKQLHPTISYSHESVLPEVDLDILDAYITVIHDHMALENALDANLHPYMETHNESGWIPEDTQIDERQFETHDTP